MEVNRILHLKEIVCLSEYIGYSINGFLQFFNIEIMQFRDKEIRYPLIESICNLQKKMYMITTPVAILHKYLQITQQIDPVIALTGNPALEYMEHNESHHRNILLLLEELISMYIFFLKTEYPVPKNSGTIDLPLFDLTLQVVNDIRLLCKKYKDKEKIYSHYLAEKGYFSEKTIERVNTIQSTVNQKFGEIAVEHGFILQDHVEKILKVQSRLKKKFGQLAIQMGFLDGQQVDSILQFQRIHFMSSRKILVLENLLLEDLSEAEVSFLEHFKKFICNDVELLQNLEKEYFFESFQEEISELWQNFKSLFLQFCQDKPSLFFLHQNLNPFSYIFQIICKNPQSMPTTVWWELLKSGIFTERKKHISLEQVLGKDCQAISDFVDHNILSVAHSTKLAIEKKNFDILLVDDDPIFSEMVKEVVEWEGHHIAIFSRGEDVVKSLSEIKADVAIVDYYMEGLDGLELLKILQQKRPNLPVIIVTGNMSTQLGSTAVRLGAYDCLDKPFKNKVLLQKLKAAYDSKTEQLDWSFSGNITRSPVIEVLQICIAGPSFWKIGN